MWSFPKAVVEFSKILEEVQLNNPEVQNLIKNRNSNHFDVVLVEFLFPELLAFAEIYNCPKILFSTLDSNAISHYLMGNPINPVLYPDIGAIFYGSLNFIERVTSVLYTWYSLFIYMDQSVVYKNKIIKEHFNVSKTTIELLSDIDLMFINVNPIIQTIRALGPSTIKIGGEREVLSTTALPQDIAEFLDGAVDGFIYFSLGSNVKSKDLDAESQRTIIETLKDLPYKILWKYEADNLPNKPNNVKLIKWAPQQTILSHPNIKLFITQGGLQSMEEGLYREVPFVVIPFFGDQDLNAKVMESKGIAVIVDRRPSISKTKLEAAILEVINNPKYKYNVKRLKQLALDFPMSGLEKAVWWTEYVIRNKGAKHLRNPAADLPFYQYYLLDVVGFLSLVIVTALVLIYITFRTAHRYIKLLISKTSVNSRSNVKKLQ